MYKLKHGINSATGKYNSEKQFLSVATQTKTEKIVR